MIPLLLILWAAGIAVILRDLDREQTARMKAERKQALQIELLEVHASAKTEDAVKRFYLAQNRAADYQRWRVRFREAEHIRHIRQLRLLWDGTVNIGETA